MIRIPVAFRAFAVVLSALAVAPVHAQNLKIGVVNFTTLQEEAPQTQQMATVLQDEFASRQRELMNKEQELQKQQETFQRDASVMGEQERLNLERIIRDGQRDLQRAGNEFREDLNIRRNEEIAKLNRTLIQEVQNYARSQGYDLVVTDTLYHSSTVDITEAVLGALRASR
jgi:outer membrane protein